jgi:hypothetical protein
MMLSTPEAVREANEKRRQVLMAVRQRRKIIRHRYAALKAPPKNPKISTHSVKPFLWHVCYRRSEREVTLHTRPRPLASPCECITKMVFLRGRIFGFSTPGRTSLAPGCQHGRSLPPLNQAKRRPCGKPSFCSLVRSAIIGSVYE